MQDREPPAYQEYPAAMLSKLEFRRLSFAERGMLMTMRFECWVNKRLPESPKDLAAFLGRDEEEVTQTLPAVMPFFTKEHGHIVCPELDNYRQHLAERRVKQSNGGKSGAILTNARHRLSNADATLTIPSGKARLSRRGTRESLVQSSTEKQSQNPSLENGDNSHAAWTADYENAEATEYAKASGRH